MHIAICDDDEAIVTQLESILTVGVGDGLFSASWESYDSGEKLWDDLWAGKRFDLIFLDIQMGQLDGLTLGRKIRQELQDKVTSLIYISNCPNYALSLYETYPLTFFVKPLEEEKIRQVLTAVGEKVQTNRSYFVYTKEGEQHYVQLIDILYFESKGKKVQIITNNGQDDFKDKLANVKQELEEKGFISIHKSLLVNRQHIRTYYSKNVRLDNGQTLPISQSHRSDVQRKIVKDRREQS